MVKVHTLGLMETSMQVNSKVLKQMVKVHTPGLMEESMKGDSRMGKNMGEVHSLQLRDTSMQENGEEINLGTSNFMTKTETSLESW